MKAGTETIKHYVSTLPHQPGVYRMLDEKGTVLYVGKARDLKNRVSSYCSLAGKNNRLAKMILSTQSMEFITTRNEAEALLLEANLIKKLEPKYNILLRDGKSFPFLLMTNHAFPRIQKYRGTKSDSGNHFGPFASAGDVDKTIKQLQRVFLLRPCTDNMFNSRNRPCLQYQIKRCSAPCVDTISKQDYGALVSQAKRFLRGESRKIQKNLTTQMQKFSDAQNYEEAAKLRDRLRALGQIQREQGLYFPHVKNADMIAIVKEKNIACVQVFFFRDGQNFGNQVHFISSPNDETEAEILMAFLPQFYQLQKLPKQCLISHSLDEQDLLSDALGVTINVPKRGDKATAMQQVLKNAKQALSRHLDTRLSNQALFEKIAELFELDALPERIEVYDNSHISGSHSVGAMIVATIEGFKKNHYRKFNIKSAEGDDDYAMMREVFRRRLKRLKDDKNAAIPLLLIDGGKGQLSAVLEILKEMELDNEIPLVAISKGPDRHAGREKFHLPGRAMFQLPVDDPTLHYLQRLRDEAHRFAITAHRGKRSSALKKSALDDIKGIGAKRKKALLQHFGSARAVTNASVSELAQVEGISETIAAKLWQQFHH